MSELFWSESLNQPRCPDLTKCPRGYLQCLLVAGHNRDPRSFHHVDPFGAVVNACPALFVDAMFGEYSGAQCQRPDDGHEDHQHWKPERRINWSKGGSTIAPRQAGDDAWDDDYVCSRCGAREWWHFSSTPVDPTLCFGCNHWAKLAEITEPERVVINGRHYQVHPDRGGGPGTGFGGSRFVIRRFDGREHVTRNLWDQGDVPPAWREQFPDNAEFVPVVRGG